MLFSMQRTMSKTVEWNSNDASNKKENGPGFHLDNILLHSGRILHFSPDATANYRSYSIPLLNVEPISSLFCTLFFREMTALPLMTNIMIKNCNCFNGWLRFAYPFAIFSPSTFPSSDLHNLPAFFFSHAFAKLLIKSFNQKYSMRTLVCTSERSSHPSRLWPQSAPPPHASFVARAFFLFFRAPQQQFRFSFRAQSNFYILHPKYYIEIH